MSDPVIVTGFHRSGTSAVTELLQAAGLFVGDDLLGRGPFNPRGHFEDRGAVELHERALKRRGLTWLAESPPTPLNDRELRAWKRYLASRPEGAWGFKDPRASLFLNHWLEIAPASKTIIMIRPPAEAVTSLIDRQNRLPQPRFRRYPGMLLLDEPELAWRAWMTYADCLVTHATTYHANTVVIGFGKLLAGWPLIDEINRRWGLQLAAIEPSTVIDPRLVSDRGRSVSLPPKAVEDRWKRLLALEAR